MSELSTMPPYELNSFARWLAYATEAYFENPDVQRRFKEWEKEHESNENEYEK